MKVIRMALGQQTAADQLIACANAVARLANHREIKAAHVSAVEHDLEIRAVLDRVIRRWSRLVPVTYTTDAAQRAGRAETAIEHVVPCRVLIDRMIMDPPTGAATA